MHPNSKFQNYGNKGIFRNMMQDFNLNRKGRNLRKYCSDEGDRLQVAVFFICSIPTDMRKGREGLVTIVCEYFHRDSLAYDEAFVFYNMKYDTVKILHYDLNFGKYIEHILTCMKDGDKD